MRCFKEKEFGGWCKGEELLTAPDKNQYCIFHAPMEAKKGKEKIFQQRFYKRLNSAIGTQPDLDFSGMISPIPISFIEFTTLPNFQFDDCEFYREVHFYGGEYNNVVHLTRSKFFDTLSIDKSIFHKGLKISGILHNGLKIHTAIFNSKTHIEVKCVDCDIFFGNCPSISDLEFINLASNGELSIIKSNISSLQMNNINSKISIIFENSILNTIHFNHIKFKSLKFYQCKFGEEIVFNKCKMDGIHLHGIPLDLLRMTYCDWPMANERYIISDEVIDLKDIETNKLRGRPIPPTSRNISDMYRFLKKIYKDNNDELMVSSWHYKEKEWEKIALTEKSNRTPSDYFLLIMLSVYKHISGYGEEPGRALVWLIGLFAALCSLLHISGLSIAHGVTPWADIQTLRVAPGNFTWAQLGVLFSATLEHVIFLKSPDYLPITPFGKIAINIIGKILIPIQAALFAFALRNKLRR